MTYDDVEKLRLNRRDFLRGTAMSSLALCSATSIASQGLMPSQVACETRSLDEIYQAALDEGGKLVIYAGGDFDSQQDNVKTAFKSRFPDMDLTIVVDYSKFHDVRFDTQIAMNNVIPDVVQLQTIQNFDRWASQGKLLPYKPATFDSLHPLFREANGYWSSVMVVPFSYYVNETLTSHYLPASPYELTAAKWKGRIASSYPHDDDAVAFLYRLYVETYGFEWLEAMAGQNIQFNRGSHIAGDLAKAGSKAIGIGGSGSVKFNGQSGATWVLPDTEPFMAWGQRAGIPCAAKHPEAAKLYLNWMLSDDVQQTYWTGWTVRTDIQPDSGLSPIWEYPNAHLYDFPNFMADRESVELWRQTFALFFGEVKGDPTSGNLGLFPGA